MRTVSWIFNEQLGALPYGMADISIVEKSGREPWWPDTDSRAQDSILFMFTVNISTPDQKTLIWLTLCPL